MLNKNVSPLITQVRTSYFSYDCGMAYIIRLYDGSFVIIDGNIGEYDEPDHIMELLEKQNVTGEKVRIAAWFITHAHGDHYLGFINFCRKFGDRITIERVIYDFPPKEVYFEGADLTDFDATVKFAADSFGAEVITPKSGDRYEIGGATFDVLYIYSDLLPEKVMGMNNSSLVMRMELSGYRVMWFGDIERQAADNIMSRYSKDELKCDIMQVAHHGYTGASDELYRAVDPEIVLWPCPDFWYHPGCRWKCNDYLAHSSENIKATFVAGQTEVTLDLTKSIEASSPYEAGRIEADIAKKSMCALHWTNLTGGGRGYLPMKLTFGEDDTLRLVAGDARSLCQMIQRGQVALSDKYEFSFKGILDEGYEAFGLIFDHTDPMTWDDEKLHLIEQAPGVWFTYTLKVDRAEGIAELYEGGALKYSFDSIETAPADVILYMKNGTVTLSEVVFENK